MSTKKKKEIALAQTSARRSTRNKRNKYPSEMYGARLKLDDAKILDDYGKEHKLKRADVVRLALHQFALKRQMSYSAKDPVSRLQEQIIGEQIAPLKIRLDELAATLQSLTKHLSDNQQKGLSSNIGNNSGGSHSPTIDNESIIHFNQAFTEQRQMLERILVATTLALRLTVNYTIEPALRKVTSEKTGELTTHLQAADKGREYWSEATRQVVRRTGNRILQELNFLPKEP